MEPTTRPRTMMSVQSSSYENYQQSQLRDPSQNNQSLQLNTSAFRSEKECSVCNAKFGIIGIMHAKKYNCKFCFHGVCGNCSQQRIYHPVLQKNSRCCKVCYENQINTVSEINQFQSHIRNHEELYNRTLNQYNNAKEAADGFELDIESYNKQIEVAQTDKVEQISNMEESIKRIDKEVRDLQLKLELENSIMDDIQNEVTQKQEDQNSLEFQVQELQTQIENEVNEQEHIDEEINQFKQVNSTVDDFLKIKDALDAVKQSLGTARKDFQFYKLSHERKTQRLKNKITQLRVQQENSLTDAELEILQKYNKLNSENEDIRREIQKIRHENKTQPKLLERELQTLKEQLRKEHKEYQSLLLTIPKEVIRYERILQEESKQAQALQEKLDKIERQRELFLRNNQEALKPYQSMIGKKKKKDCLIF